MAIRPIILYASKCWATKKHVQKMSATKMKTLRWRSGNTQRDRILYEIKG